MAARRPKRVVTRTVLLIVLVDGEQLSSVLNTWLRTREPPLQQRHFVLRSAHLEPCVALSSTVSASIG
ncbi:hypothetical protein [Promicromonospora sp. NPDC023987]|uniref:hypothetical protein n=1 Tax=Promicromonospora sp. NPDC023987 TaxID=3155360 RepID=UPI0033D0F003